MTDLRIAGKGRGEALTIRVNGKVHRAYTGESVHAALLAAGYRVLRKTGPDQRPRGIFCGMGVCYDCLVTINGVPNQRACMTLVADGMEVAIDA